MSVEFLTDEQAASYGKFNEEPTRPELERFFFLDDEDRKLIAKRRGDHSRLGFALQMCTVRYIGRFLPDDLLDVPWVVVEHLAAQLDIEDVSCVKRYTERKPTAYEHTWEIRDAYEYREYEDAEWSRRFRTFLHGRAWTHAEGPVALFNQAVGWLRRHRVLLPGVSVLARQVSEARAVAEKRLHATVAGAAFARALERVDEISAYRLGRLKLSQIPPNRMAALARYALGSKAPLLERATEVNAWTGFLDAFVHLGDGSRMKDLPTSVVALLVSETCNIGLAPVVNPGYEALTRARLVHVDQYYLRADTIAAANARLIEAQAAVPIVKFWGDGLLASVDGLRFVVPVHTMNAAPSPKYFGFKRGITWLNAVNDQVAGIGQMVVPGTPRDSLHILDALLSLDGGVKPEMVATDNASYSDVVFGLFKILGYNFSPRFRDLDDQRFWRATMPGVETGAYGAVEDLARNRVNLNKVITHWPDMLKVAGSLVTNQVRAYDLLRMFGREGRPTPLGAAFAEYGRIAKTEHPLRVVDPVDDTYRRQMNRQLTVQESRHKLARDVCHGKRGTIHQAYRDGMEDQLGALGLVLNAIVLWTTKYIDAAVEQLRAEGHELRDEDIARLSPLKHRNLNLLARYSFTASVPAAGALRPLRDPDGPELDEDDDGRED
ncbi:Tn3 family transposase [Saccharopolyspora shandongensis]